MTYLYKVFIIWSWGLKGFMNTGVIFDFNRTIYDPEQGRLFRDALPCLQALYVKGPLGLITTKTKGRNKTLFTKLGVIDYFAHIQITSQKKEADFQLLCRKFQLPPSRVYVIGDRLDEEIAIGNQLGMPTVWIYRGSHQAKSRNIRPSFVISSLEELDLLVTGASYARR